MKEPTEMSSPFMHYGREKQSKAPKNKFVSKTPRTPQTRFKTPYGGGQDGKRNYANVE